MVKQQPQHAQLHEKDQDEEEFSPTGTLLFVMLMLIGYALYWGYLWFIVVIEQG